MPPKRKRVAPPQTSEPAQPPKRDAAAVPSEYMCPISDEIMRDPVVCADGVTYDRPSIELWFAGGHSTNPVTCEQLPHLTLKPNLDLRKRVNKLIRERLKPKLDVLAEKNAQYVNLVVKNDDEPTYFRIKRSTPLSKLIDSYCQRKSLDTRAVRFMFDGNRIEPSKTPKMLRMEDNDVIDAMLTKIGSIGIFVCNESIVCDHGVTLPASSAPGVHWLMQPSAPCAPPPPEAVAAIAAALHGSSSARPPVPHSAPAFSCVSPAACAELRARVDRAHLAFASAKTQDKTTRLVVNDVAHGVVSNSCADDFRILMTVQQLRLIIGRDACARILSELETDSPDAIALRRTTASGRWINFHTDTAARTVQVMGGSFVSKPFFLKRDSCADSPH